MQANKYRDAGRESTRRDQRVTYVAKLIDLTLQDGIYLCAGYSSLRVSHCLVIRVFEGEKFVSDETTFNQGIQQCDLEWLYGISFLRKVDLYSVGSP